MLHWPIFPSCVKDTRATLDETWRAMELLLDRGTCRAIGVSNFSILELEELMERASVIPHVNAQHVIIKFIISTHNPHLISR